MRDIYKAATQVIILIGSHPAETDDMLRSIHDLGDMLKELGLWDALLAKQNALVA
jgi:hypothetical protein